MDTDPDNINDADSERYGRLVSSTGLTLDLLSAYSGDRSLLEPERILLEQLQQKRGELFFSDILFLITHQHFPVEIAETLWTAILSHKYQLSRELGRNVKLVVASLDYLSNTTTTMKEVTLISEQNMANLIRLYQHDGLTGLFNHAHFYQTLRVHLGYYARYKTPFSLLMIDVDDFKRFNDAHGHQAGDTLLFLLGELIQKTVRDVDICCRYGGEEFAIILPLTPAPQAVMLAERLRKAVATTLPEQYKATVSIGVATSDKNADTDALLVNKADSALYTAKSNGKNQVVMSEPLRDKHISAD